MPRLDRRTVVVVVCLLAWTARLDATDRDGGNDCARPTTDWGDAPEGITAYMGFPTTAGRFPTCSALGVAGTDDFDPACPPIGSPQLGNPTGHVRHVQSGSGNFWLGCSGSADSPAGIDSESDGLTAFGLYPLPPSTPSACDPALIVDAVETPNYPWSIGGDEVILGTDASMPTGYSLFYTCQLYGLPISTYNCGNSRLAYLNICMDMNRDGDWNDSFRCGSTCGYEWAVKNAPITLPAGCYTQASPSFPVGPNRAQSWFRISISVDPVPETFPWQGSAGNTETDGALMGGETEDYTVNIFEATVSTGRMRWGTLKILYR